MPFISLSPTLSGLVLYSKVHHLKGKCGEQSVSMQSGKVDSVTIGVQGTGVNLEAENEGMLGSGQQATIMQGLPPERLALNRKPLEDKVSRTFYPAEACC